MDDNTERPEPPEGFELIEFEGEYEPSETEKAWLQEDPEDYDWMTKMDVEILYVLMKGLTLTPSVIADNLERSRPAVSQRLNSLQAGGLIKKTDRGKYKISEKGVGYIEAGAPTVNTK